MVNFELITIAIMTIEFSVILGAIFYFGKKAQSLERIEKDVSELKHNMRVLVNHHIKYDSDFDSSLLM